MKDLTEVDHDLLLYRALISIRVIARPWLQNYRTEVSGFALLNDYDNTLE